MLRKFLILIFLFLSIVNLYPQSQSNFKKFWKLQRPEKWWVLAHPFVAGKAMKATQKAKEASRIQLNNRKLDGYESGGQIDAFRHAYWMALLVRDMKTQKAIRLGKAHEKSNYLTFKKQKKEDGQYPDLASKQMDLYNNRKGVEIGETYKLFDENVLQKVIIDSVLAGKMKILKRDTLGNFLKCNGNVISSDSLNNWDNGKCLIKSDYTE